MAPEEISYLLELPDGIDLDECPSWIRRSLGEYPSFGVAYELAVRIGQWASKPARVTAHPARQITSPPSR